MLVCIPAAGALSAQNQAPPQALQPNPTAALQAFEAPADQPYQLGRGDDITVDVLGRPELSGKHTIGPDGEITLPIVGSLQVAGETRRQAALAIQQALTPYYAGITVTVGVDKYTSNQVLVLGAVEHPGVISFEHTPTLLEAISKAGVTAVGSTALQSASSSRPNGIPDECIIYRGNSQMVTVELRALLDEGSPLANLRLQRDDIVYVTGKSSYVAVLGQVSHPGNQRLEPNTTIADLIAEAGGPTEKAGRNPSIEIVHRNGASAVLSTQSIPFKDLMRPGMTDVTLHSGDIIFVPESGFNGAAYTFAQIAPLVNLFTIGALLKQGQ